MRLALSDSRLSSKAMAPEEEVFDSSRGWVARHIRRYVETDGRKGHRWSGVHTLLLTTRGRRTGKLRRTALIYGRDGDRYLVVASRGGAKHHPSWYLNLAENPEVQVQVGADRFTARASTATSEEKPRLWRSMASIWPEYDSYQVKTERDIPVVILERLATNDARSEPGPHEGGSAEPAGG
jgi:deazaflavin-dependent oxidoreductase (nitroreductase family)